MMRGGGWRLTLTAVAVVVVVEMIGLAPALLAERRAVLGRQAATAEIRLRLTPDATAPQAGVLSARLAPATEAEAALPAGVRRAVPLADASWSLAVAGETAWLLLWRQEGRLGVVAASAVAQGEALAMVVDADRLGDDLRRAAGRCLLGVLPWAVLAGLGVFAGVRGARKAPATEASEAAARLAVGKVAHDLRGILSPALLAAERLLTNPDAAARKAGDDVVQAIDRAIALLKRTLDGGRGG